MALNSGKILMRRGQEVNFDPNKMMPGEWAVSLDSKYVRMCFSPGVCVRMATYEAFEADMEQIRQILAECQTVEEAVQRIYEEIKDAVVDVERIEAAAASALKSEENALNSANSAIQSANTSTQKANEAAGSANIASAKAEQATQGANTATEGASTATQKASEAAESAGNVRNMSEVSQSYAVGGTGTREGEDTDNAKYYNQQASGNADRAEEAAERASVVAGFGGTYTELRNKPTINDVELVGNKTLDELGIASKEALEETDNKVNIIIEKAELNIKETAMGENIHLIDSAEGKAVEFALYGKATQDGTPTPQNPQEIEVSGESYNLLEITETGQSVDGVEFVVNEDKSVRAKGTAKGVQTFDIPITLEKGSYKASIGFNGSVNAAGLHLYRKSDSYFFLNGSEPDGSEFTVQEETLCVFRLRIANGATVDTLFYPMIRKASVKNERYMPYGKGSVEVKSVGKNKLKNTATSQTINGVTFVVNEDKSVTVNGTATAAIDYPINQTTVFENGTYILSGCPSGGSAATYRLRCTRGFDSTKNETGTGVSFTKTSGEDPLYLKIDISSGTVLNNLVFKPMVRLATDTDDTYEPYKETISTIPTENGLAGIPVDSDGNYTDSNGQQWICDEIVKYADGSGEKIQRVEKKRLTSDLNITKSSNTNVDRYLVTINPSPVTKKYSICTFATFTNNIQDYVIGEFGLDTNINNTRFSVNFADYGTTTLNDFKTFLDSGEYYCLYVLPEPIRTPLTAEEIAEIEKVSTFYPATNISNDFDCGMKVKYIVDSKNYIDNQLAIQAKLQEEALLNMLLLMPEEVQASMIEKDTNNLLNESEV